MAKVLIVDQLIVEVEWNSQYPSSITFVYGNAVLSWILTSYAFTQFSFPHEEVVAIQAPLA